MPLPDSTHERPGGFRSGRRLGLFLATGVALAALLSWLRRGGGAARAGLQRHPRGGGTRSGSPNRFPFGLADKSGAFLEGAEVSVRFFELQGETSRFHAEAQAAWRQVEGTTPHLHDDGELHLHLDYAGLYVVDEVTFPSAGFWGAEFVVDDGTLTEGTAFQVLAEASAPLVGAAAPPTENLTIHDAPFAEISTRPVEATRCTTCRWRRRSTRVNRSSSSSRRPGSA